MRDLPDADALRRAFFETYLPNDYLAKVDSATMAASLEARSPFLDVDLVTYILRLPIRAVFPGGVPRPCSGPWWNACSLANSLIDGRRGSESPSAAGCSGN